MKINSTKATNFEMTDAIASYINEKLEAIEKFTQDFEPVAEMDIEVAKTTNHHAKGPFFYAEMNLHIPGQVIRATNEAEDLYAAIDAVKDEVIRQLKDHKERMIEKNRGPRPDKA